MHALRFALAGFVLVLTTAPPARAQTPAAMAEGPLLTLQTAIDEALERNPALLALRRASDAAATRPAQEKSLMPPMVEAQIWQWPIDTINPWNANMFMLSASQELPGKGKRDLCVRLMDSARAHPLRSSPPSTAPAPRAGVTATRADPRAGVRRRRP